MLRDKDKIAHFVESKFSELNGYIAKREKPEGNVKFYSEEIDYWVNQIFESNWTEQLFLTEFENTYKVQHKKSLSSFENNDYIGQTFKIDPDKFKNGIF